MPGPPVSGARTILIGLAEICARPTENQFNDMRIANPKDISEYGIMGILNVVGRVIFTLIG
jgi:hypothetical protein